MGNVEINKISGKEKSIEIIIDGKSKVYPACFYSREGEKKEVIIKSVNPAIKEITVKIDDLKINGSTSNTTAEAVITLNEFIGNFKSPGGTGTTNPAEWGDIGGDIDSQSDLKDRFTVLDNKIDGIINDVELDSVTTTVSARRTMHIPVMQSVDKTNFNVVKVKTLRNAAGFTEGQEITVNGVACKIPKLSFNPTPSRANLPSSVNWYSITYGNGMFVVIVNESTFAAYSLDGVKWTTTPMPNYANWRSVTYGNGMFVAISGSDSDRAAYSLDGIKWTATTLPSSESWRSVTYGNGIFVAVANGSKSAYSLDGIKWIATAFPSSVSWLSVTYGNGVFVAVANSNIAAYSLDGVKWTTTPMPSSAYWLSVTYGNGVFAAVANGSNKAAYSFDGINWIATILPSNLSWNSVTYGNEMFITVASSSDIAAYSLDGFNWNAAGSNRANWNSVAYGSSKFVAVANNSSDVALYNINLLPANSALILENPSAVYDDDPAGTFLDNGNVFDIQTSYSVGKVEILSKMRYVSEADPLVQDSCIKNRLDGKLDKGQDDNVPRIVLNGELHIPEISLPGIVEIPFWKGDEFLGFGGFILTADITKLRAGDKLGIRGLIEFDITRPFEYVSTDYFVNTDTPIIINIPDNPSDGNGIEISFYDGQMIIMYQSFAMVYQLLEVVIHRDGMVDSQSIVQRKELKETINPILQSIEGINNNIDSVKKMWDGSNGFEAAGGTMSIKRDSTTFWVKANTDNTLASCGITSDSSSLFIYKATTRHMDSGGTEIVTVNKVACSANVPVTLATDLGKSLGSVFTASVVRTPDKQIYDFTCFVSAYGLGAQNHRGQTFISVI